MDNSELNTDFSVDELFERKFHFSRVNDWQLPATLPDKNEQWNINSLTALKQELNLAKSLLNDKGEDWHVHTASTNKAAYVINAIKARITPELLTQAWCKFYEILASFDLFESESTSIRSLHLCEAPGAFISALNYYLCANHPSIYWEWIANTLNPYYEGHSIRNVVVDDRLLFCTMKNWNFGKDNTGDITDPYYINDLCDASEKQGFFNLVTADGSFDCLSNPGEQEAVVAELQFAEVLVALSCLLPGGSLVIKKFTFFESITITQLYILNCAFMEVHVFKPFTSKSSNSEVYVICIGFKHSEELSKLLSHYHHIYKTQKLMATYPKNEIPISFLQQIEACALYFAKLQIDGIKENVALYPIIDEKLTQRLNEVKESCAEAFVQKYHLKPSSLYDSCKLYFTKKKIVTSFFDKEKKDHKSIYFLAVGDTFNNMQKCSSLTWHEKLSDVENRINALFPIDKKRTHEEIEWAYPWKEIRKKMRSKTFQNWVTIGKSFNIIQNSKFCYPVILYLWNEVSHNSQIKIKLHSSSLCYWPVDELTEALRAPSSSKQIISLPSNGNSDEKDSLLKCLEQNLNLEICYKGIKEFKDQIYKLDKIVYINTTMSVDSLHQECFIKSHLTEQLLTALEILKKGDDLVLCIQSLLTRFSVGLIFIVISLFEKFTVILPNDLAPAAVGKVWILKNFQEALCLNNATRLLQKVKQLNLLESEDILEIIPMTSLCGGLFHIYLRNINNKHLLQRIRSFISVEKCRK